MKLSLENGERRVESGECSVENGLERRVKSEVQSGVSSGVEVRVKSRVESGALR